VLLLLTPGRGRLLLRDGLLRGLGRRGRLVRVLAPENQHLSDRLDRVRAEAFAEQRHPGDAGLPVVGGGLHLDQLVGAKRPVDLGDDGVGKTLVADDHDGGEFMGLGAQLAAAGGSQGGHAGIMTRIARGGSR